MSGSWFVLRNHLLTKGSNADLGVRDPRVGDLYLQVEERIGSGFQGRKWLKRRYPGERQVEISLRLADVTQFRPPMAGDVQIRRKTVACLVECPAFWFTNVVDGLLGVRITIAAMAGIAAVGEALGIGNPEPQQWWAPSGTSEEPDIFAPRQIAPTFGCATARVNELLAEMIDGEILVVAPTGVTGHTTQVRDRMLTAIEARPLPCGNQELEVAFWKARL